MRLKTLLTAVAASSLLVSPVLANSAASLSVANASDSQAQSQKGSNVPYWILAGFASMAAYFAFFHGNGNSDGPANGVSK